MRIERDRSEKVSGTYYGVAVNTVPDPASGMTAAWTWSRRLCGTWEPVAPMRREPLKWRPHESPSTDAGHRGGATCRVCWAASKKGVRNLVWCGSQYGSWRLFPPWHLLPPRSPQRPDAAVVGPGTLVAVSPHRSSEFQ